MKQTEDDNASGIFKSIGGFLSKIIAKWWAGDIHSAASTGDFYAVKAFLEDVGVDARASGVVGWLGQTPLHIAAGKGHIDIVDLLIKRGADVKARSLLEKTPLHYAAEIGCTQAVSLLIENGADIEAVDEHQLTPLQSAAICGHADTVDLLIKKNANLEACDDKQRTALHAAAEKGHLAVATLLIKANANKGARDKSQLTPLLIAAICGVDKNEMSDYVIDPNNVKQVFPGRPRNNQVEVATLLLENGADIHEQTADGKTALHLACLHGNSVMVDLLIKNGADKNAKDNRGNIPLDLAVLNHKDRVVSIFFQKKAVQSGRKRKCEKNQPCSSLTFSNDKSSLKESGEANQEAKNFPEPVEYVRLPSDSEDEFTEFVPKSEYVEIIAKRQKKV